MKRSLLHTTFVAYNGNDIDSRPVVPEMSVEESEKVPGEEAAVEATVNGLKSASIGATLFCQIRISRIRTHADRFDRGEPYAQRR
ncbi:hypothetical protein HPB50_026013 [Hyalomma asiaticum]|uniref:Uncharacterized protein n=1 Tax=Hyalomma asiaticum TaxID=266040 RepID=A0ACB7SQU7_HYAAI|nr:hypothetical protein HPB50_026013 [Hyalomma asiaticum]